MDPTTASRPAAPAEASRPGRRKGQGERTRRQILDTAAGVLAVRGYHETRVDDIAEAAGVSHGTFYLYFTDKSDLVRQLAQECAADMVPLVEQLQDLESLPTTYASLRRWIASYVSAFDAHAAIIRLWSEQIVDDPVLEELGDTVIRELVGQLSKMLVSVDRARPADPRVASLALVALLERYPHYGLSHEAVRGRDNLVETLTKLVLRGFLGGARR